MSRRGSQAVEFALIGPILLGFICAICDLSQILYVHDALVAAVSAGARAGAQVEGYTGKDPLVVAQAAATQAWRVSRVPGQPSFAVRYEGASPDRMIVVEGTVPFTPWFGIYPLPETVWHQTTLQTTIQP